MRKMDQPYAIEFQNVSISFDDKPVLDRQFNRQIGRLAALENFIDEDGGLTIGRFTIVSIGHETPGSRKRCIRRKCRKSMLDRKFRNPPMRKAGLHDNRIGLPFRDVFEMCAELIGAVHHHGLDVYVQSFRRCLDVL